MQYMTSDLALSELQTREMRPISLAFCTVQSSLRLADGMPQLGLTSVRSGSMYGVNYAMHPSQTTLVYQSYS
jgi:hypothetical protein